MDDKEKEQAKSVLNRKNNKDIAEGIQSEQLEQANIKIYDDIVADIDPYSALMQDFSSVENVQNTLYIPDVKDVSGTAVSLTFMRNDKFVDLNIIEKLVEKENAQKVEKDKEVPNESGDLKELPSVAQIENTSPDVSDIELLNSMNTFTQEPNIEFKNININIPENTKELFNVEEKPVDDIAELNKIEEANEQYKNKTKSSKNDINSGGLEDILADISNEAERRDLGNG